MRAWNPLFDLISCSPFLLCFPINSGYVVEIHYWFDLILTVSLVLCYQQQVCVWNFISDLISCWPFLLCFPINSLYVLGISLLIWSHADSFSCVFLLTECMCLEFHYGFHLMLTISHVSFHSKKGTWRNERFVTLGDKLWPLQSVHAWNSILIWSHIDCAF